MSRPESGHAVCCRVLHLGLRCNPRRHYPDLWWWNIACRLQRELLPAPNLGEFLAVYFQYLLQEWYSDTVKALYQLLWGYNRLYIPSLLGYFTHLLLVFRAMQHGLLLFGISNLIFTAGMAVEDIIKMWLSSSQLRDPVDICFRTSSELDSDVSLTAVLKYLETGHQRIILISNK